MNKPKLPDNWNCYELDVHEVDWDFRPEGRKWEGDEIWRKYALTPEKIELLEAKVFAEDNERLHMIALLIENVGLDAVVRLGDPQAWRDAVARLDATED